MSGLELARQRHNEIRTALRFFINSWHKHRQALSVAEPQGVLGELIRFRAFQASLQANYTPPEVQAMPDKPAAAKGRRQPQRQRK
jgi:hypothetical protein